MNNFTQIVQSLKKAPLKKQLATKSQKTVARIDAIKESIRAHRRNRSFLIALAEGRKKLDLSDCTPEAQLYQQTPEDAARLPRTLDNLQSQIHALSHELTVLLEYGA